MTNHAASTSGPYPAAGDDLEEKLGYQIPGLDWLQEHAPAYAAVRRRLMAYVFTPDDPVFPVKYREIVAAMVAATRSAPDTEVHLRRAIREGATIQEILEAIQVAERPSGATMLHAAMEALVRIHAEQAEGASR